MGFKLLPCPFCGAPAKRIYDTRNAGMDGSYRTFEIACSNYKICGCSTPAFAIDGFYGSKTTESDVIEIWNRRV